MRSSPSTPASPLAFGRLLILGWIACAFGCSPPERTPLQAAGRLISVEPTTELHAEWLGPRSPTRQWDLLDAAARDAWSAPEDEAAWSAGGLELRSPRVRILHERPVRSAAVTGLRIVLDSTRGCQLRVGWKKGRLFWVDSTSASPGDDALSVDLAAHPEWSGTLDSLRLVVRRCAGRRLYRIVFEGPPEGTPTLLPADLPAAWKVTLAGDTRNAVLAAPGTTHRWSVTRAVDVGELRFGVGVFGQPDADVKFLVHSLDGGRERLLASRALPAEAAGSHAGWRELAIPVRDLAEGSELAIEARSSEPWEIEASIPVLAAPRVVAGSGRGRPNVLLISIDTLRADRLSLYGYERETSPNIGRRARQTGITFASVVAPSGWTLPSHVSMFSGVSALRHGVNFATLTPSSVELVAERFRAAGHETVAFSAGGFVSAAFGLSRGFESFRTRRDENPSAATSRHELEDGVEQFVAWLDSDPPEPFFAFFHTYEVHAPYWARAPFFERFGGDPAEVPRGYGSTHQIREGEGRETRRFVVPVDGGDPKPATLPLVATLYDSGVAFMDSQIERLFEALEHRGLLEETVVVLTSDHGESLGEHDFAGHGPAHEEVALVPLVIWPLGGAGGVTVDEQVQLVDVAPTLLDLAGLDTPAGLDGASLRPFWEDGGDYPQRPAWIHAGNYGVATRHANRLKYIWHRVPWDHFGAGEELYDLRSDPDEQRNLVEADETLLSSARERMRQALDRQLPGLELVFESEGGGPYGVRVSSDANRPSGVMGFGCGKLAWVPTRRVALEVSRSNRCFLTLEHLHAGPLQIEVASADQSAPPLPILEFDTVEVTEPRTYVLRDGAWLLDPPTTGGALTVRSAWKRPPVTEGETDAEMDEALIEQLRALGYIE